MAEAALLERLSSGAWGGGVLVHDIRAHLKPLMDVQKENADIKFAERYNAFISKVVSQATKAAQGADGTTSGLPISLDAAEHAVEAGSIALTCLEKIRGDLKYKVLDYERSVHAFIAKAVLAKKYDVAVRHCEALLKVLKESQAVPAKDRKAHLAAPFLPLEKDRADFAELAICVIVYLITCRMNLGQVAEDSIEKTMKGAVEPWLQFVQKKGEQAPLAYEALFRFFHNIAKSPDQITDTETFVHAAALRAKSLEYYTQKLSGGQPALFLDFYLALTPRLELAAAKDPKRWKSLLDMHCHTVKAAEARLNGTWVHSTPLAAKWAVVYYHVILSAAKAGDAKSGALVKKAEDLIEKDLRSEQPALAALHAARIACVELDAAYEVMGRDLDGLMGKVALRLAAVLSACEVNATLGEEVANYCYKLGRDLDALRRTIKASFSSTGKLKASPIWQKANSRGENKRRFDQLRAGALDALDTVTLITLEADKTKVDECRDILRTLASSATDAEASIAARSYYNIATLLYTDHSYLAAVEFYEIACEFTERAVHAGDKEAEEKLQSRLTFLAEARLKSGVSATPTLTDTQGALCDLARAVQVALKGSAAPVEAIERFVRKVLKGAKAQPSLVTDEEFLKSALLSTHLTKSNAQQVALVLRGQSRALQENIAIAPECAVAILKRINVLLKEMCAGDPLEKARLLLEEAKQARLSEDRTTAIACLSEADKCLDGVTGEQKIVDLAAVLAWRVQVLIEAKSEEVAGVLERTKQLWIDVRDQLPTSAAAVNSLRASMKTLLEFLVAHEHLTLQLAFARLGLAFEVKLSGGLSTPHDLCGAHLRVAEAAAASGREVVAGKEMSATMKAFASVTVPVERCKLQLRMCVVQCSLGRTTEGLALARDAHNFLQREKNPTPELLAMCSFAYACLLREGVRIYDRDSDDSLGEAISYALVAQKFRRRALALRTGEEGSTFSDLIMPEFSDMATLHSYVQELYLTGTLYALAGIVREAEFYLTRGSELAGRMAAPRALVRFLLAQAELEYHRHKYQRAQELLDQAEKEYTSVKGIMDAETEEQYEIESTDVELDMRRGDVCRRTASLRTLQKEQQQDWSAAREYYESAQSMLDEDLGESGGDKTVFPALAAQLLRKRASLHLALGELDDAERLLQEAINSPIAIESLKSRVQLLRLLVQRAERAGELTALWTNTRSVAVTKPRVALSSSKKKAAARSAAAAAAAAPIAAKKSIVDTALEHAQVIVDKARVFSSPSILGNLGSLLAQLSGPISGDHRGAKAIQECASVSLRHAICSHVLRSKIPAPLCVPSSVAAPATASTKDICAALEQLSLNSEADPLRLFGFASAGQRDEALRQLPKQWTVCALQVSPDCGHLLVSRVSSRGAPIVLRLPLVTAEADNFRALQADFADVMKGNTTTVENNKGMQNKEWWGMRKSLNAKLEQLCADMEEKWLGCWKGILLGPIVDEEEAEELQTAVERTLELITPAAKSPIDKQLLELCVDSMPRLSPREVQECLVTLLGCERDKALIELAKSVWAMAGTRSDSLAREAVILVLDKRTQAMPWECIPILFDSPVCRAPSVHYVIARGAQLAKLAERNCVRDGVDDSKTFYVLNPAGDLIKSQATLEPHFTSRKWPGVAGVEPSQAFLMEHMQADDLFIYCGHNAGELYLSPETVQALPRSPVALLIGCSSGRLSDLGDFEPFGSILAYLQAGSAAALGNLWHVTDLDIDRFTEALLEAWLGPEREYKSLSEVIPLARRACKFPYLVGAAPVCYGVPVYLKGSPALRTLAPPK